MTSLSDSPVTVAVGVTEASVTTPLTRRQSILDDVSPTTERVLVTAAAEWSFPDKLRSPTMARKYEIR